MKRALAAAAPQADAPVRSRGASRAARRSAARLPRWVPGAIALALLGALGVAALRVDLIRVRYGLAEALEEEKALLAERRATLAQLRALRDPGRLAGVAERQGFVRPERIVDLPVAPPTAARRP